MTAGRIAERVRKIETAPREALLKHQEAHNNGKLEAMAAGGLKTFRGGGIEISMPIRADVALWKDRNGAWQGILQGHDGAVPDM